MSEKNHAKTQLKKSLDQLRELQERNAFLGSVIVLLLRQFTGGRLAFLPSSLAAIARFKLGIGRGPGFLTPQERNLYLGVPAELLEAATVLQLFDEGEAPPPAEAGEIDITQRLAQAKAEGDQRRVDGLLGDSSGEVKRG